MTRFFLVVPFTLLLLLARAQDQKKAVVIRGVRTAITPRLKNWKPDFSDPALKIKMRDEKGLIFARDLEPLRFNDYGSPYAGPDPVLQKGLRDMQDRNRPESKIQAWDLQHDMGVITNDFDGIGFSNVAPADPTLAVGPNHIIQMVNGNGGSAFFRIFQKNGQGLGLQAFMDQLPGSSYNGAGDCITFYDQLTDRFVMSEFGDSSKTGTSVNSLIIAVSQTNDPLGSWYVYEFSDASFFPDYPKFSNWHDAWYGMTRDFAGAYVGNSVWAFDKTKMLAGDPTATVQRVRITSPDNIYNSMCPVTLAGNTPAPAGTPGMFLYYNDDNFTASADDRDSVGIVGFKVDFANPSNSVVSIIQSLPVAAFKSNVCNSRNCAPSPGTQGYDVISSRIMNKPYYRNFGTYQAIVANHTVDATGTGVSGIRWYELRKDVGNWSVFQQGTFSPQNIIPCTNPATVHRFMGAITLNSYGQIAMAYNNSSATAYASLSFSGRNSNDPPNIMSYEETIATTGTGYGTFGNRWGDYSEIVPDVTDDSLFWFTGMYGATGGWKTRILSFKLGPNRNLDARLLSIDYPNACVSSCSSVVQPQVSFRNSGNTALTSLLINYQVNNDPPVAFPWTGNLKISEQVSVTLPPTMFPPGTSNFTVYLSNINGMGSDENLANDTLRTQTSVGTGVNLPLSEGFESNLFPAPGWTLSGNTSPAVNWDRTTVASKTGAASIFFDNFNQNQPGKYGEIRTPLINLNGADSLSLRFWVANAIFDNDNLDTLEILVSTDCGNTFSSVWKKWGQDLVTRTGFISTPFVPTADEWKQVKIELNNYTSSGKLIIAFRNINGFGNNLYIDDINLDGIVLPANDIDVFGYNAPVNFTCSNPLQPAVNFINLGRDTLKTANFHYSIDGGTPQSVTWKGALKRRDIATVVLPGQNLTPGNHLILAYSSDPNGGTDANNSNDSTRQLFMMKKELSTPLAEGFEGVSFPPDQWNRVNPDTGITWERTTQAGKSGLASAFVNNYRYTPANQADLLISPLMHYEGVDSIFLSFQVAAATRYYPGGTDIPVDTLEVLVSDNCGSDFTTVYKKWGTDLQTLDNSNSPTTVEFFPKNPDEWRNEKLNLTDILGTRNSFVVMFRNTSNTGNNIFIDDVNIYTKTLAPKLKNKGYLISPNPFTDRLVIQHFPRADDLKGIQVYSAVGQLVYSRSFTPGTADSYIEINLAGLPAAMYIVKLSYTDRVVTERVIKGKY